jgi:hypothetical protein
MGNLAKRHVHSKNFGKSYQIGVVWHKHSHGITHPQPLQGGEREACFFANTIENQKK